MTFPIFLLSLSNGLESQVASGMVHAFGSAWLTILVVAVALYALCMIIGLNTATTAIIIVPFVFFIVSSSVAEPGFGGFDALKAVLYLVAGAIVTTAILRFLRK